MLDNFKIDIGASNPPEEFKQIFKYTSVRSAELIISSLSIRFQNPAKFNDPFDCRSSGVYYNHRSMDEYCLKDFDILKQIYPTLSENMHLLDKAYRHSVENKIKDCAVSCFTSHENNQLMWAHYANNHYGVMLGFNNTDELILNARMDIVGTMNYGDFPKVNYCESKIGGLARIFLTKSKDWEYEKEIRFVTMQGEGDYLFNPSSLTTVTFGLRCDDDQAKSIIEMCNTNGLNPEFRKAKIVEEQLKYYDLDRRA